MIKIAPSILSADFTKLGEELRSIETADYVHMDVMDGLFVPNISFGLPILESVRRFTDMVLDVHLMIEKPVRYVSDYAEAGADIVVFHVEADDDRNTLRAIEQVKSQGKKVGLSLRPKTPAQALSPYIKLLDTVLVMTVEPGFGGQGFMADTMPKITAVRNMINDAGTVCDIEVDGGINPETAKLCVNAGANVLVSGSFVFKAADRAARIRELRG